MQLLEEVERAMNFAREYHKGQYRIGRGGKTSYYDEHILGVYNILKNEYHITDSEILVTALLHDTVEDTKCTFKDIETEFGAVIMQNVKLLTRMDGESFPVYTERLFSGDSEKVVVVKLADRLHNLRTILYMPDKDWIEKKVNQTYKDILERLDDFLIKNKENNFRDTILDLAQEIREQLILVSSELEIRHGSKNT